MKKTQFGSGFQGFYAIFANFWSIRALGWLKHSKYLKNRRRQGFCEERTFYFPPIFNMGKENI